MRPLVKKLDSHHLWDDGPLTGLSDLLDVMPGLEDLAVYRRQCHPLRNHPVWRQLKSLKVLVDEYEDNFEDSDGSDDERCSLKSTDYPNALHTLTIRGTLHPSRNGSNWSKLSFPHVQTFILDHGKLSRIQEQIPENVQLLPSLPQLRMLKAFQCVSDEAGERLLCKIVKENATSIEHLILSHKGTSGRGRLLLSSELLPFLQNLRALDFRGAAKVPSQNTLRSIFPESLSQLKLHWYHDIDFGFELLQLLADRADIFLPNLQAIPNLIFQPKGIVTDTSADNGDGAVTRYQLQKLLQLAYQSQVSLMRRGVVQEPGASYPEYYDNFSITTICLPFPQAYKSSLSDLQRGIMDSLEAKGELSVEGIR